MKKLLSLLKDVEIIAKGGAGSGDKKGHIFHGNQYVSGLANKMLDAIKKEGGFTYESHTATPVNEGFAVGVFPQKSGHWNLDELNTKHISDWLKDNKEALNSPMTKIGGWHNKEDNSVWLDVVRVYPKDMRDLAEDMGRKANQVAIANLEAISKGDWDNAFVNTGGTGEAVNLKTGEKIKKSNFGSSMIMFDRDVTPEKIIQILKG